MNFSLFVYLYYSLLLININLGGKIFEVPTLDDSFPIFNVLNRPNVNNENGSTKSIVNSYHSTLCQHDEPSNNRKETQKELMKQQPLLQGTRKDKSVFLKIMKIK